jgi:hypothetical protein
MTALSMSTPQKPHTLVLLMMFVAAASALMTAVLLRFDMTPIVVDAAPLQASATPVFASAPRYEPVVAAPCSIANAGTDTAAPSLLVRSAPAEAYAPFAVLAPGQAIHALGQTGDGWVAVAYGERQGWLRRDSAALNGDCAALPVLLNPTIPTAPEDPAAFLFEVDRDGEGTFSQAVSAPYGDTLDIVWISVINLYSAPPNNYREFAVSLVCEGMNTEGLRWGIAASPTLTCGQSMVMPFLFGQSQQPLAVLFPQSAAQGYADYHLTAIMGDAVG